MRNLVPRFILENFVKNQFRGKFPGICLFVDLIGFTRMSERVMRRAKEASESLADVLTDIFEPLVISVYSQKGFIGGFAGDSFLAIFQGDDEETYHRALRAAYDIQQRFAYSPFYGTPYGNFQIAGKIGLASGTVEWGIIGSESNPPRCAYYFRGDPVDKSAVAEQAAKKGDLIITKDLYLHIKELVQAEPISMGNSINYFRILDVVGNLPKGEKIQFTPIPYKIVGQFLPPNISELPDRGEFRNVATLFIGLQEPFDHELFDRFIKQIFQLSEQYGGSLAHIDFGDKGCNLLCFWGTPITYENDVERALNFILDLLKLKPDINFKAGVTYRLMYAGFAGSDIRSEYSCYGLGINLASRLMVNAGWGEVWMDQATVDQANRIDERFNIKIVGKLSFKGVEKKLPIYKLLGRSEFARGHSARKPPKLIGRRKKLIALDKFIQPIFHQKSAGVCCLYGEAGIGKTRLIQEFRYLCDTTRPDGVTWFHCSFDEIPRQTLYPFRRLLEGYFGCLHDQCESEKKEAFLSCIKKLVSRTTDETVRKELERTSDLLAPVIGLHLENSLYDQLDPKLRLDNTLNALECFFKSESLIRPVIIELEDVHYADEGSLQLIRQLSRNLTGYPIAIITSYRSIHSSSLPLFFETVSEKIEMTVLSKKETALFCEEILSNKISPRMKELLNRQTGCNPFFIEQMTLFMEKNDLLTNSPEGWGPKETTMGIPVDVQSLLTARLDRLDSKVRSFVQTAAILGQEFELSILSNMLPNKIDLRRELKVVEEESIWTPVSENRYIFKHTLMRDTAYEMQLQSKRRERHASAARVYEKVYGDHPTSHLGELAYHYEMAGITGKAITYFEKAGDYARENYHNNQAIIYYDKLIHLLTIVSPFEFPSSVSEKNKMKKIGGGRQFQKNKSEKWLKEKLIDIFHKKGKIFEVTGEWSAAETIFVEILSLTQSLGDKPRLAKTYQLLGWILHLKGENREAEKNLQAALQLNEELDDQQEIAHTVGKIGNIYYVQGEYEKAMEYFKKDLQISAKFNHQLGVSIALNNMGNVYRRLGDYDRAMGCYKQKLLLNEEMKDKKGISITIGNMGSVYFEQGDFYRAKSSYEKYLSISEELGDRLMVSISLHKMGNIYYMKGDYIRAMWYYERRLELSRELGDKKGIVRTLGKFGSVYSSMGDYKNAMSYYEEAIQMSRDSGIRSDLSQILVDKATLMFLLKRYEEAERLNKEGLTLAEMANQKDVLFRSKMLSARLALAMHDSTSHDLKTSTAFHQLVDMLNEVKNKVEKAELHYELWKLSLDRSHQQEALRLYQEALDKASNAQFKERIRHLSAGRSNYA
ncbi:MAG: hypothetical protein B6244_01390 [Candidatus Cloacimonetes bacterium 4572_55]|nr:MAG: hypothetical protein B6244_01390 [Candidatus Cloacimonetes bacterium 4572_55]